MTNNTSSSLLSPLLLNDFLIWGVPYTNQDDVICTFIEIIECPIMRSTCDNMIVFNNQYYESTAFEQHRIIKFDEIQHRNDSNYSPQTLNFKCLWTNTNFNFEVVMRDLYKIKLTIEECRDWINRRFRTISPNQVMGFVSANICNWLITISAFV